MELMRPSARLCPAPPQARVDAGRRLLQETDHDHAHDHGANAGVDMKPLELNLTGASGPPPLCMRSSP